jgi:hypothetical protein
MPIGLNKTPKTHASQQQLKLVMQRLPATALQKRLSASFSIFWGAILLMVS